MPSSLGLMRSKRINTHQVLKTVLVPGKHSLSISLYFGYINKGCVFTYLCIFSTWCETWQILAERWVEFK